MNTETADGKTWEELRSTARELAGQRLEALERLQTMAREMVEGEMGPEEMRTRAEAIATEADRKRREFEAQTAEMTAELREELAAHSAHYAERAQETVEVARQRAEKQADRYEHEMHRRADRLPVPVADTVESYPWASVSIALGVGVMLGSIIGAILSMPFRRRPARESRDDEAVVI